MPVDVGEFIRARRRELGLTQQEVATRANISVRAVRDIERGHVRQPHPQSLRRIFDVVGAWTPTPDPAGPDGRDALRIAVLGPLTVRLADEPIALPHRESLVLGLLALHAGVPVHRHAVVDLLWAHDPPDSCHNLVHTYIARLRRRFATVREPGDGSLIDTVGDRYRLRTDRDQLDLLAFARLTDASSAGVPDGDEDKLHRLGRALALWRGPVLAGTTPALTEQPAAMALNRQRVATAIRYATLAVELGRPEDAVHELQSVADNEPLHERLHALLMRALAGSGQQARALDLYQELRKRLAEQLGVEPGPELREIHLRILRRGEPAKAVPTSPPSGAAERTLLGPPLFDRDVQLAALRRLAEAARAGRGSVAFVRGAAGMGKTALLDAWSLAERPGGMRVTRVAAGRAEQGFAFAVARQLLEPLTPDAEAAIARPGRAVVDGGASFGGRAGSGGRAGADEESPHEVLQALYRLVVRACDDGPLAMLVDDAQWMDSPSTRWLEYLSRRIAGLPVLLVLTGRPEDGAADQFGGQVIVLPELSAAAATHWVRQECADADAEFCQACVEAAEGDPSLLGALLEALRTQGVPPTADQAPRVAQIAEGLLAVAVARRLSGEDEASRRLVQALVVLGDGADWLVVAALSGLGGAQSRDPADRLRRIGVLASDGTARFRRPALHAVLAEAVTSPAELAAGHARAAELLYAESAPAERVADHLVLAEPGAGDWRVGVLREAARAARGRGVPEAGVKYLRRALREPLSVEHRGDLVLELGSDEVLSDPTATARRLSSVLPGLADPLARAWAASLLADALAATMRSGEALEVIERAVADLGEPDGWDGTGREIWLRLEAQSVFFGCERPATLPAALQRAERLRALDLPGDTPGQRAALLALSVPAMMGEGDAATVEDLIDRGLRGETATDAQSAGLLEVAAFGYTLTDRLDDAALRYGQLRDLAGRYGGPAHAARALAGLSNVAWRRGDRMPPVPPFEGAFLTDVQARLMLLTVALHSLVERGDPEGAAAVLAQYASGDVVDSAWWAPVLMAAGRVHAECGDVKGALALLTTYGRFEEQGGLGNPAAVSWRTAAARIYAAFGQREQAIELATEELAAARRWGTARVIGTALSCLGAVVGGAEGRARLADAVAVLEPSPARRELAWAKYEWGLAVSRTGDPATGLDILGDALRLAEVGGAQLLAGRIRAELVAAGVRLGP